VLGLFLVFAELLDWCLTLPRRMPDGLAKNFARKSVDRDASLSDIYTKLKMRAEIVAKFAVSKEPPLRNFVIGVYGSPGCGKSHFLDQIMKLEFKDCSAAKEDIEAKSVLMKFGRQGLCQRSSSFHHLQ
jgi:hypothetical protein